MIEESRADGRVAEPHPLWRWVGRNVWLILLAVVAGAATGFLVAESVPITFESERIVVASESDISAESFGKLAETVFETDTVLQPVIDEVGLEGSSESLLRSGRVAVEPISNAAAVRIIGRSSDATLAAGLATSAARSFTGTAEDRGMGRFEVFGGTGGPAQPTTPSTLLWTVLGGTAGGLIAFLVLLFVSFVREPVLSEDEARGEMPVDAAFAVRVRKRARGRGRRKRDWLVSPAGVGTAIWRALDVGSRVDGQGAGEGTEVACILVERGSRDHAWLRAVVGQLAEASRGHGEQPPRVSVFRWNSLDPEGGEMVAALERAAAIVLLVAEGTSGKVLGDLNEVIQSFTQGRRVLVLARLRWSWLGRAGRIAESGNGIESDQGSRAGVRADDSAAPGSSRQTILDVLDPLDAEGAPAPPPRRGRDLREDLSSKGVSEAVDALVRRLGDPNPEVRIEAAQVLGELGAPQAVEPLQRSMAAEPQMSVAFAIAQALRKLGRPVRERGGS